MEKHKGPEATLADHPEAEAPSAGAAVKQRVLQTPSLHYRQQHR